MKKMFIVCTLAALTGCAMQPVATTPVGPAAPVFFQPFSVALDAPAQAVIASAAQSAKGTPQARVIVTGAADSVGSEKLNDYISEARAQIVADTLVQDGVPEERIEIRANGITQALTPVPNGTPAQSARRVLIQLVE